MINKSAYVTHEGTKGEVIIICLKIYKDGIIYLWGKNTVISIINSAFAMAS